MPTNTKATTKRTSSTELVSTPITTPALAAANPVETLLASAIEKSGGMEAPSLQGLCDLFSMFDEKRAAALTDQRIAEFQAECPIIPKRKKGYGGQYMFSPLPDIVQTIRPLLKKHGITIAFDSHTEDDRVTARCTVTVANGAARHSSFECGIDTNAKNSMSRPQRYGAALTFAKRYALINALGIVCADEADIDDPAPQPTSLESMKQQLWVIARPIHGGDVAVLESFLQDQEFISGPLKECTAEQLEAACASTEAFLAEAAASNDGGALPC